MCQNFLLLFYILNIWLHPAACEILVSWTGIEPSPPALEGRVLTTGPPVEVKVALLCLTLCDAMGYIYIYSPWNSPGQNNGVDSLFLLQGVFPTQRSNPGKSPKPPSFLRLNSSPLNYIYTMFCLSLHPSVDNWIVLTFCLLCKMLL